MSNDSQDQPQAPLPGTIQHPDGTNSQAPLVPASIQTASTSKPHNDFVGMSGSELMAMQKPKRGPWLRRLLIGAGILATAFAGFLILGWYVSSLHPTTYDNGKNEKFRLNYYGLSSTKKFFNGGQTPVGDDANALMSQIIVDPTLRLALTIHSVDKDPQLTASHRPNLCSKYSFHVDMAASSKGATVCAVSPGDIPMVYVFGFQDKDGKYYVGTVAYDYEQTSDPSTAKEILRNIDLRSRNADIEKIIASIQPQ